METTKTNTGSRPAVSLALLLLALIAPAPAAAGIVAEWRMDEAAWTGETDEVRELIGGAHGTAFGPATTTTGLLCRGGDFSADGITDYLTLDNTVLSGRTTFSISVWVRTANNGRQAIVSGARSGQNNELIMWFVNASRFRPFIRGSSNPGQVNLASPINDNNWHHLVWTRSGASNCLYVDGALAGCVNRPTAALQIDPGGLIIGQEQDSVGNRFDANQEFEGLMDELLIFDTALSLAEVQAIRNNHLAGNGWDGQPRTCPALVAEYRMDEESWSGTAGEVADVGGAGLNATAVNGAVTDRASPALGGSPGTCGYGDFDGSDDYLALPASFPDLTGSFTITAWIRARSLGNDQRIFVDDETNVGGFAFSLGDGGNGRLRLFSRSVNPVVVDTQNAEILPDTWHFVAAVHDAAGRTRQIYVDGVARPLSTGGTVSTYTGTWGADPGRAAVGGETNAAGSEATANWRFDGNIDELRVFTGALSQPQIQDLMMATHPCPAGAAEMEVDRFSLNDTTLDPTWTTIEFNRTYTATPLVFILATNQGADPAAVRVRNVTTTGFEASVVEPTGSGGPHEAMDIDYLAIVPGISTLPDGRVLEAGVRQTQAIQHGSGVPGAESWSSLTFTTPFADRPAFLAAIQSVANESAAPPSTPPVPWITAAVRDTNNNVNDIEFALGRAEVNDGGSVTTPETIGYLAVEGNVQGSFLASGSNILYETIVTPDAIRGWSNQNCAAGVGQLFGFVSPFAAAPLAFATIRSHDGGDGGWLRRCRIQASEIGLAVDEDQFRDNDRSHTTERASVLAFSESFCLPTCDEGGVDHFDIDHDGSGINCLAEQVVVIVEDDENATVADYEGTVTLDTGSGAGGWALVSGTAANFSDADPDDGVATYTFAPGDLGVATFALDYQQGPSPINIAVSDGTIADDDLEGLLDFGPTGFVITASPLPNPAPAVVNDPVGTQVAGVPFDLHISAFGETPSDPSCGVIEAYDGAQTVQFWSTYDDPGTGSRPVTLDAVAIAGSEAAAVPRSVAFTAGQASFTVGGGNPANYKDVGRIAINLVDTTVAEPLTGIRGGSNLFVVQPADFRLTQIQRSSDAFPNPAAGDENGGIFLRAGEAFSVTITAVDADGDATPNYGRELAAESVRLESTLVAGGGTSNPAIAAPLGPGAFVGGTATGTDFSWGEVGIIALSGRVADGDYLGSGDVAGSATGNVGRFTPFEFDVQLTRIGAFKAACGTVFSYTGQPFDYDAGLTPQITITALNLAGGTTLNYDGAWWKLADFVETVSHDGVLPGAVTLDTGSGGHTPVDCSASTCNGQFTATFTGPFRYDRGAVPAEPFDALIDILVPISDDDGVSAASNPFVIEDIGFVDGARQRWGRLRLDNAVGSELVALVQPLTAEFFSGGAFVGNIDDGCTSLAPANLALRSVAEALEQRDGDVLINGAGACPGVGCSAAAFTANLAPPPTFIGGNAGLLFSAPALPGAADVRVDLGSGAQGADQPWLQFDWDGDGAQDDDPRGRISFGVFSGPRQRIYVRELWR